MGGQSTGSFSVENGMGQFRGEVAIVPSLQAPGFIKAQTDWNLFTAMPDISSCKAIFINARHTADEEFMGYRLQFGLQLFSKCGFFSSGFKSIFKVPVGEEFQRIEIPFSDFSDCNSDSTGEPIRTCSADSSTCPDYSTLRNVKTIALWGEGAAGTVSLDIKSIGATDCRAAKLALEVIASASIAMMASF